MFTGLFDLGLLQVSLNCLKNFDACSVSSCLILPRMNVIRQPKRGGGNPGGSRPLIMTNQKPKGRGRGAIDFDPIQYRPGRQRGTSTSSSGEMRTPSNLALQMGLISSAHRGSSSSTHTDSANPSTPSGHSLIHPMLRSRVFARQSSSSSSNVTPRATSIMGPPKTPRSNLFTPRNSLIVSSTPRTTPTSGSTGELHHSHVILAVSEGRGHARGEVGIAVIDIKRPRLILCQLSDRQTYVNTLTKISVFQPVEILVPNTFVDSNQPNKLYKLLEEKFPFVSMSKVQRRLFRDSDGLEKVQHLCLPQNSSCQLILQDKFYALAAAAALLKYVEFVQNVIFAAHSLKVEYQGAHHGTIIDVITAKNLELLLNQQSNNASHTLVKVIDHCCTNGGSRLLRASLLHPPCSLPFITKRQDSVQELVEKPDVAQKIREVFRQLPDVEQLLTLCMQTPSTIDSTQAMETRVNYVLQLKTALESLPHIVAAMENVQSSLLCKAKKCLEDPRGNLMKARILQTLNEDVKAPKGGKTAVFQKCFAVKSGINDLMDVARKTYCELINDMHENVIELGSTYSLPLKMNYSVTRGYHIQVPIQKNHPVKKSDLPAQFVQVQQSRNCFTCTTDTLILANERIKYITTDILTLSNTLLSSILNDIREHIGYLYEMCESIAEVDLALSLSQISRSHNYVRPKFGDKLCLKASRHPILESIASCDPIANDIEATSWQNMSVITGPNMSGKSIYIRQVLLLQIMAQVGCYVPAEEATFRITDRIFSHLNFDDSIENNASTLALEMKEMQLILSSITATSLVALDELCRGTSVEEGTAIAWSLCEELSQSTAFVFVTTHFRELTRLSSLYPSIKNIYLETVEHEFSDKKCRLVYTHRLLPGVNPAENYGLRLAENLDVPKPVLEMSKTFASQIRNTSEANLISDIGDETYTLAMALHKLKVLTTTDGLTVDELKTFQLNVRKEIREAQQRKQDVILSKQMEQHAVAEDIQSNVVAHQQNLCGYSSSEAGLSPIVSKASERMFPENPISEASERMFLENPILEASERMFPENPISGGSDYGSPKSHDNGRCPSPEEETPKSSLPEDNIDAHDSTLCSSPTLNLTAISTLDTPRSVTSFCSQHTWLAQTPDQSSRYSESKCPSSRRSQSFSDASDSGSDENSSLSHFRSELSMSNSMMSVYDEDKVTNGQSFNAFCKPQDISRQSKDRSTDFFSQSTAILSQNSVASNPFQFINEQQSFQSLFKSTDTPLKKRLPIFPASFFMSPRISEHLNDEGLSSPPMASRTPQTNNPQKRTSADFNAPSEQGYIDEGPSTPFTTSKTPQTSNPQKRTSGDFYSQREQGCIDKGPSIHKTPQTSTPQKRGIGGFYSPSDHGYTHKTPQTSTSQKRASGGLYSPSDHGYIDESPGHSSNPRKRASSDSCSPISGSKKSLQVSAEKKIHSSGKNLLEQAPKGGFHSLQLVMDSYCSSGSDSD
ncbi:mutS protein homolog 4-like isoform X2 [Thrips palmi]|uniref:MutS protein homolog 4-like isoform X2 n=1 Tax=Thrips palmi TaxID=161013 RepID=A0A6P9A2K5_THRPL|nr:mutS protein homolog 4-like isoform X2 [Thrips palmi]